MQQPRYFLRIGTTRNVSRYFNASIAHVDVRRISIKTNNCFEYGRVLDIDMGFGCARVWDKMLFSYACVKKKFVAGEQSSDGGKV